MVSDALGDAPEAERTVRGPVADGDQVCLGGRLDQLVRGPVAGNRQGPDVAAEPSLELPTDAERRIRRR